MLCIPPRGETVFTNLVAQGAETDAEHFRGNSPIPVSESQSFFQVKLFYLPDWGPRRRG